MPPREWRLRVDDILDAIARIQQYVAVRRRPHVRRVPGGSENGRCCSAQSRIIGEAVRHLSASQEGLPGETPWADIAGMRNILIHQYFGVDLKIIWHTIVEDLPKLKVQVRGLVP